jgi:hypothetical protein
MSYMYDPATCGPEADGKPPKRLVLLSTGRAGSTALWEAIVSQGFQGEVIHAHCYEPLRIENMTVLHLMRNPLGVALSLRDWTESDAGVGMLSLHLKEFYGDCISLGTPTTFMRSRKEKVSHAWLQQREGALQGLVRNGTCDVFDIFGHMRRWLGWRDPVLSKVSIKYESLQSAEGEAALRRLLCLPRFRGIPSTNFTHQANKSHAWYRTNVSLPWQQRWAQLSTETQQAFNETFADAVRWYDSLPGACFTPVNRSGIYAHEAVIRQCACYMNRSMAGECTPEMTIDIRKQNPYHASRICQSWLEQQSPATRARSSPPRLASP